MIKYFPTFLAGTSEEELLSFTIITDEIVLSKENIKIVSIEKKDNTLSEIKCDSSFLNNEINLNAVGNKYYIMIPKVSELKTLHNKCSKGNFSLLGIQVSFANAIESDNISSKEEIFIPIYFESNSPLLLENRVLGVSESLIQSSLQCTRDQLFRKEEFVCNLSVKNVSEYPIVIRVISQKQGITNIEKIEVENLLLVEGAAKGVSIPISFEDIQIGENRLGSVVTVASVSGKGLPYSVSDTASFYYFPWVLIVLVIGLVLLLSVILKNYIQTKITALKVWQKRKRRNSHKS